MKFSDTVYDDAGVIRCCLSSFKSINDNDEVTLGQTLKCQHCDDGFTLIEREPPKFRKKQCRYVWVGSWIAEKLNKESHSGHAVECTSADGCVPHCPRKGTRSELTGSR
jgi:hypothetical protein